MSEAELYIIFGAISAMVIQAMPKRWLPVI
jgi:hypothetical protein